MAIERIAGELGIGERSVLDPGPQDVVDEQNEVVGIGRDAWSWGRCAIGADWGLKVVAAVKAVRRVRNGVWVSNADNDSVRLGGFDGSSAAEIFGGTHAQRVPIEDVPEINVRYGSVEMDSWLWR
jgi:hypothetical protein